MRCFCIDINATKTGLLLKINRNTINRYFNIFRRVIYRAQTQELKAFKGDIEMDESYFGATRLRGHKGKLKRGRGTLKQPVFGIFERNGRVYTEIVPDCKKATLQKIILGKVNLESVIHTDSWRGYAGLVDVGYDKHFRVNHGKGEYSNKHGVHVNGIESFWSFTKRRLAKFNGVKVNFALHLKECEWRWNKNYIDLENNLCTIVNNI
jgi:transposase-like protein